MGDDPTHGRLSRGPITEEGKRKAPLDGLRHGLLSKNIVLPGESKEMFEALLNQYVDKLRPPVIQRRAARFPDQHFEDVVIVLCVRWYLRCSRPDVTWLPVNELPDNIMVLADLPYRDVFGDTNHMEWGWHMKHHKVTGEMPNFMVHEIIRFAAARTCEQKSSKRNMTTPKRT